MTAEDSQENGSRADGRSGNLPGDAAGQQQIEATGQQTQGRAANDAAGIAQAHGNNVNGVAGGNLRQGRCSGHAVQGVAGHGHAEGNQQKRTTRQGRVHDVVTQAAEQALDHQDCKHGAKHRHIHRHFSRQGQGKQQTGNHRAGIPQGVAPLGCKIKQVFGNHRRRDGNQHHKSGVPAVRPHAQNSRGQQRHQHIPHHSLCGKAAAVMGGAGKMQ